MKNKKIIAAILSLLITTQPAFAAGAIASSEPECVSRGSNRCFSVDRTYGVIITNRETISEARNDALSNCRSNADDSSECRIATTFGHGQCAAAVVARGQLGENGYPGEVFIGTGSTQSTAERTAIAACESGADGGSSACGGATSDCDTYTETSSPPTTPPPTTMPPQENNDPLNSCRHANDNECDEERFSGNVTSLCASGTDTNDCRGLSLASTGGSSTSSDDDDNTLLYVAGGAALVGILLLTSSGYAEDAWTFTPRYDISNESGFSANAGGRWDFHKDEWHLYFSGDGSTNGKFNYQSGGSYTADFWTAEFSESVSGKTADYDLSLSSDFGSGIWKLSPTYRLHSEYADSEFDTQNSLNLESEFRYNNWEIRPTAGFNWREFGEFADSGTFRINAVHRF